MSTELLSALSDRRRLAVLGALCTAEDPTSVRDLVEHTGHSERDVQRALAVLGGAGLVDSSEDGVTANLAPIRAAVDAAVAATPIGRVSARYPRLGGCLKNGRIATIPADGALQVELAHMVMDALADRPDYTEPEVTGLLAELCDEPVALRRLLVDAGCLARDPSGNRYWRP